MTSSNFVLLRLATNISFGYPKNHTNSGDDNIRALEDHLEKIRNIPGTNIKI